MTIKLIKMSALIGILAVTLLLAPVSAMAITTYDLVVPNPTGLADPLKSPPPYGTVTVSLTDSTHATITFATPLTQTLGYSDYYSFIDGGIMALNVNGGNPTGSNISVSTPVASDEHGVLSTQPTISRNVKVKKGIPDYVSTVSVFGDMNVVFTGPSFGQQNKTGQDIDKVSFIVTITGASWADDASVLTADGAGYRAAAHMVADISGSPGFPSGTAKTGYAADGMLPIPLPGSVLLLGSGLVGLALLRFRRRQPKS